MKITVEFDLEDLVQADEALRVPEAEAHQAGQGKLPQGHPTIRILAARKLLGFSNDMRKCCIEVWEPADIGLQPVESMTPVGYCSECGRAFWDRANGGCLCGCRTLKNEVCPGILMVKRR